MARINMLFQMLVLLYLLVNMNTLTMAKPSKNMPCQNMKQYMPPEMSRKYNMSKHNGTWYEVSFRDLYPWGPLCDCQQSIKYVNLEKGYMDDYFVFTCYPLGLHYISPQRENKTNSSSGKLHENGLYDMTVRNSDFKFITHFEWNTEMIGFKDDGQDQYKWVIEFQCGTRPYLPKFVCLDRTVDDHCFFTGIQLFVRDLDFIEEGRIEMFEYIRSLGPEVSNSLPIAWVMDDFGGGTFPPWFKNVTEHRDKKTGQDNCPRPCAHGVFNETTKMWGCPKEHKGKKLRIASPGVRLPQELLDGTMMSEELEEV